LLKSKADINKVDKDRHPALFRAVVFGHQEITELLLTQGADMMFQDLNGKTSLHLAAACGHTQCCRAILDHCKGGQCDLLANMQDFQGCTPLHWACHNGSAQCVEFILEQKLAKMMEGNPFSPVHCAVSQGSEQCLDLMLAYYGPNVVWLRDSHQYTPLHVAALSNTLECCHMLLGQRAPVDETDYRGRTPLICAASRGHIRILELLMEHRADVRARDSQLNTALHHACRNKHSDCALALLDRVQHPAVINMINKQRRTALHMAARYGLVAVTRRLLEKGASVHIVDCDGLTPALACAPSTAIAQCLSLILASSTQPQPQNNFKKYTMSLPLLNPSMSYPSDCSLMRTNYSHSSDSDFY